MMYYKAGKIKQDHMHKNALELVKGYSIALVLGCTFPPHSWLWNLTFLSAKWSRGSHTACMCVNLVYAVGTVDFAQLNVFDDIIHVLNAT